MMPKAVSDELAKIDQARQHAARNKTVAIQSVKPVNKIYTAEELDALVFPEMLWIIFSLVAEGLFILAGRPKLGKSWLALNFLIAVVFGGKALGMIEVEQGEALYCALEDSDQRLQKRLRCILGNEKLPKNLYLTTKWRPFDQGGLQDLEVFIKAHPKLRIVVFDTLERVRPLDHPKDRLYHSDYNAVAPLQNLAKKYRLCILVVHHTRKQDASDYVDLVSGSTGLTGAADGILVLKRSRGQADATLHASGRDFEDKEIALKLDLELGGWRMLGDASEYRRSNERQDVINLLKTSEALTPKAISDLLGRDRNSTKQLLWSMSRDGELHADNSGRYSLNGAAR